MRGRRTDPLAAALAAADQLSGLGRSAEAAPAYRALLSRAPSGWPPRPRVEESLAMALQDAGELRSCAEESARAAAAMPPGHSRADLVGTGLACATSADGSAPWRPGALSRLEPLAEDELARGGDDLADDRSGLFELLVDAREARADAAGAKRTAARWLAFLDAEALRAESPRARAALDEQRMLAAIAAGNPERARPALEASERELPGDFEPPSRLATLDRELGRYGESIAASDRALALAHGPRRVRLLRERAETRQRMGDRAGARADLESALGFARTLPPSERPSRDIGLAERSLADLAAATPRRPAGR